MASGAAAPVYSDPLPSGCGTLRSFPDALMICEFVFGGLVWTLVASTTMPPDYSLSQGWVMFVSIGCFVFTTAFMILYCVGAHGQRPSWTSLDAFYHSFAAMFYLSASVLQANATVLMGYIYTGPTYQENVAAVVSLESGQPFFFLIFFC
ncbi:hypothetical protein XENTR_v10013636 [Xenopus tropicalis]|nr:hypothetical protein XENTR_v10013636 [Xenopus tropicalis]